MYWDGSLEVTASRQQRCGVSKFEREIQNGRRHRGTQTTGSRRCRKAETVITCAPQKRGCTIDEPEGERRRRAQIGARPHTPDEKKQVMTAKPEAPRSNVEWSAQQLRATIFHGAGDVGDKIHEYWAKAFGSMPQQDETRNLEGVRVVGGQVSDMQWMANIRPDRVDIASQPVAAPLPGSSDVWYKPERAYQQIARELIEPSHLLVDTVSGINRLAVGALFLAPSSGISDAYAKFSVVLPDLHLEGLDAPDFSFRVNRKRQSQGSPALSVNRVATWSIAQGQTVSFGPVGSGGASRLDSGIQFAASLQLDINTVRTATGGRIPSDKAKNILSELMEMAVEIAELGDVP